VKTSQAYESRWETAASSGAHVGGGMSAIVGYTTGTAPAAVRAAARASACSAGRVTSTRQFESGLLSVIGRAASV
jgi:ABC-type taurine transport system substrate-binding protein